MHNRYISTTLTAIELERQLEEELLHKRFTLKQLENKYGESVCLGGNDLSAVNLADYNIMFEYEELDVDIYCLIDRHGLFYITEIGVNYQ